MACCLFISPQNQMILVKQKFGSSTLSICDDNHLTHSSIHSFVHQIVLCACHFLGSLQSPRQQPRQTWSACSEAIVESGGRVLNEQLPRSTVDAVVGQVSCSKDIQEERYKNMQGTVLEQRMVKEALTKETKLNMPPCAMGCSPHRLLLSPWGLFCSEAASEQYHLGTSSVTPCPLTQSLLPELIFLIFAPICLCGTQTETLTFVFCPAKQKERLGSLCHQLVLMTVGGK